MANKKAIIITSESEYAVGLLFLKSFREEGLEAHVFDLFKTINKYVLGGRIGNKVHTYWPVMAWERKANRELAVMIQQIKPEYIFISGDNPVYIGTLAFAKSILPDVKIILFWPDTLINLKLGLTSLSPMIDVLASYSKTAIRQFEAMGFRNCVWLPFAGDIEFLGRPIPENPESYKYDCSFIGGWRPEREAALQYVLDTIPGITLKIVGPLWDKRVHNKKLLPFIDTKPLYGKPYGDFLRSSRINLNIIDDTNYPAANMRFFEVPASGALQLSSSCPELKDVFWEGQHIYYFENPEELKLKIHHILYHPEEADRVRREGYALVMGHHTYRARVQNLLNYLNVTVNG